MSTPSTATEAIVRDTLPFVAVANPLATGRVYLHGAHVAQWRPVGHGEVLWMSARSLFADGKPIRGGVPVCFPWFGPHPERSDLPAHGFVRSRAWRLSGHDELPSGATRLVFATATGPETDAQWPHRADLALTVTMGTTLTLELAIVNAGGAPFTCDAALHTYFTVGDVRRARVLGLQGGEYLDRAGGQSVRARQDADAITFTGETDRFHLATEAEAVIEDPVLHRRIRIAKRGSRSTVVWNPWIAKAAKMPDFADHEWPGMLCVETANAFSDRLTIAPGATHRMAAEISVESV